MRLVVLVVYVFGIWSSGRAEDAGRQIGTTETLTAISSTEYQYAIEARNAASRSVSILVLPYAKADVPVTVTDWKTSEGLKATVVENVQTGANWSIRVELEPQQSGTLTLHLKTASPMKAPRLFTLPLRAAGLPTKVWEFYLADQGD
jgi:hypothetical protein